MGEIIERLREACPGCRCSYCADDKRDARREIERLREALQSIVDYYPQTAFAHRMAKEALEHET